MDTVFFIASKLVWATLRVESWLLLGLVLTVWGLYRNRLTLARRSATLTLLGFFAITILPLGDLLLRPLEGRYPPPALPPSVTGIIILGGAEDLSVTEQWNQQALNDAAERLTGAAALARAFPDAIVLYTGGSGELSDIGQTVNAPSETAKETLVGLGIPAHRITLESASRNTAENARFSYNLIQPQDGQTWLLVTSAFHMPRAMQSFHAAGWPGILPYPVDYRSGPLWSDLGWEPVVDMQKMNTALKEYVGLLAYGLTGR